MDVVLTPGAGVDVPTKTVRACRVIPDPLGQSADGLMEVQECGTLTRDWSALSEWLTEAGFPHVARESPGDDWKPVSNLLEGTWTVFLVKAAPGKSVPGRKTARADARWLAPLLRYGVLQASVLPPAEPRDVRDLTRDRATLVQERSWEVNRGPGVLERANSKLAAVASDRMGVSGRAIVAALLEGRAAPATMAAVAKGRWRRQIPGWEQALTGLMREPHRRLRARQLAPIDCLEEQRDPLSAEIACLLSALRALPLTLPPTPPAGGTCEGGSPAEPGPPDPPMTFARAVTVLDPMPGVEWRSGGLR